MADKLEQFEIEQEKKEKEAKKAERARQKAAEKAESARKKKEEEAAAIQAAAKAGGAAAKAAQQAAASPGVQMAPKGRVFEEEKPEPCPVENFNLNKTFKGHQMSVSSFSRFIRRPIIATASDDATWKMWDIPSGDLIMSGDGHRDWVAGVDFHPAGYAPRVGVGRLHREGLGLCAEAMHDVCGAHAGCVERGFPRVRGLHRVVLAGSQRAFVGPDFRQVQAGVPRARGQRQRGVLATHHEQLATGSSDKTVSLWDMRSGLCAQTLYGHLNSVNHLCFSTDGDVIVSCDADGMVKLWDVRMVAEILSVDCGPAPGE